MLINSSNFCHQEILKKLKEPIKQKRAQTQPHSIRQSELIRIKQQVFGKSLEDFISDQQKKFIKKIHLQQHDFKKEKLDKIQKQKDEIEKLKDQIQLNQTIKIQSQKAKQFKQKWDEENTLECREMNKMVNYARVVTIRDKQLIEKQQIREEQKNEKKRIDQEVENERLRKVKEQDDIEQQKRNQEIKGRLVIIEQMKENRKQQQIQNELKKQEGKQILKKVIEQENLDKLKKLEQIQKRSLEMTQINKYNQISIQEKQKIKLQEKLELEQIMEYNKQKAIKEEEYLKQQKLKNDLKEKEINELRKAQEKHMDIHSELDKLRAKRTWVREERNIRQKQIEEQLKNQKMTLELQKSRKQQITEKEKKLIEQASRDKAEFQKILIELKRKQKLDQENGDRKEEQKKSFCGFLQKMTKENELQRQQAYKNKLEEGYKLKQNIENQKKVFLKKKKEKLDILDKENIAEKYKSDLQLMKFIDL